MQVSILGSPFDSVANAVSGRLSRLGHNVTHCSLEALAGARWRHALRNGEVVSNVTLADGTELRGTIFNRLRYEPAMLFTRMKATDRDYARAEFMALLLSWLQSLGTRVIGRPTTSSLSGASLGAWQWLAAAVGAGFLPYPGTATTSARRSPRPPAAMAWPALLPGCENPVLDQLGFNRPRAYAPVPLAHRRLVVVDACVLGEAEPALARQSVQLAHAVDADVLAIDVAQISRDPRWRFIGATTWPETLEQPEVDALVALIAGRP